MDSGSAFRVMLSQQFPESVRTGVRFLLPGGLNGLKISFPGRAESVNFRTPCAQESVFSFCAAVWTQDSLFQAMLSQQFTESVRTGVSFIHLWQPYGLRIGFLGHAESVNFRTPHTTGVRFLRSESRIDSGFAFRAMLSQ